MTAYYNEIEPYAADWLRELIKKGHIADGIVDTRSIVAVDAADLRDFDQCHFFAGIGVWSHALRLAGWPDDRPVWTGSCPCQPFSAAGKGKGFDDERHLWPVFHRLISECRPPVVFGEQVASKDGLQWLDAVCADMEASGYAIGAADLCAAGVGAPHIRQRLWFVGERLADAESSGSGAGLRDSGSARQRRDLVADGGSDGGLGHHHHQGLEGQRDGHQTESGWLGAVRPVAEAGEPRGLADHDEGRRAQFGAARLHDHRQSRHDAAGRRADEWLADAQHDDGRADEPGRGSEGRAVDGRGGAAVRLADAMSAGWSEGRAIAGDRQASCSCGDSRPSPTNGHWRDADWLHCRDGKWRPVEPGTFPLAHGAPSRVGRLRAYGNAIVGQVAAEVIGAYMEALR